MLIDVKSYSHSLKKLWSDTFGDDEKYINLLFDHDYTPAECFAEISEGEVISVLYLLRGYIKCDADIYEGRYLYAAATAKSHRGKGIMARLIKEARSYTAENNISFISLVPADEGLYGYYSRFGFEAKMKNYISVAENHSRDCSETKATADAYLSARKKLSTPFFSFAEEEWKYALSCLSYSGYEIFKNTDDSFYIVNGDRTEVLEFIGSEKSVSENALKLSDKVKDGATIVSPYGLSGISECRENKFGMIYFADEKMKEKITESIYMNIALD